MAKKAIGIDVGRTHVCAVQASRRQGQIRLEKILFRPMRRSDDSPQKLLAALVSEHGFDAQAVVALAAPSEGLFLNHLTCDSRQPDVLHQALRAALTENLPVPVERIVADVCMTALSDSQAQAMTVVAGERAVRQEHQELAAYVGRPADRMDAPIFALLAVVLANHPEMALAPSLLVYLNETHLIAGVLNEGQLVLSRNLPVPIPLEEAQIAGLALELELTWRRACHQPLPPATPLFLAASETPRMAWLTRITEHLQGKVVMVDPVAALACTSPRPDHAHYALAAGLALRTLAPNDYPGINLLKDPAHHQRHQQGHRRQIVIAASLVVAVVLVGAVGLLIQRFAAERTYRQLQGQISAVFAAALPGEPCLQPVEQLREKLKTLQEEYTLLAPLGAADPLTLLTLLTDNTPPELHIVIESMNLDRGQLVLSARGPSFRTPYQWQEQLQKVAGFTAVAVGDDARLLPDQQGVKFSLTITLNPQ